MSVPFRVRDALDWTGGSLLQGGEQASLSGASIDSRSIGSGELFVAIVGGRLDGHDYLAAAAGGGAGGLLVERGRALPGDLKPDLPVLAVDDTTRALGALATGHRAGFDGPLVAITGSNGKTSTKEMCAAVLDVDAPCLKNPGNLNNHWGLPVSLLRREPEHKSVVVELGMNHRGEIAVLAAIARPTIGVITNVGVAHIGNLGSQDAIALEKGDLVASLPAGAVAVLNADDARVLAQAERTDARVVRFGRAQSADVRFVDPRRAGRAMAFTLVTPDGSVPVEVAGLGDAVLSNAAAAAAAALAAGASLQQVARGLAGYRPVAGRLEAQELPGGALLIDDSYNANPQSLELALGLLADLGRDGGGRTFAVLGDMGELGDRAEAAHAAAGALAARLGIDVLIALGEHAARVVEAASRAGLADARVARDHEDAAERVRERLAPGDRVLVKGSRSMQMERVARALAGEKD